jgi:hypothetical protein
MAQESGFSPAYLFSSLRLVGYRELQSSAPAREECSKYDLIPGLCFDWSVIMIGRAQVGIRDAPRAKNC